MNLKEVKQRILSVKTTQKITSAMKLVSAAKLRRAQSAIEGMRPYEQKLDEILSGYLHSTQTITTPYATAREVKSVALIVVSSSSSLCGTFNSNIIRLAKDVIDAYHADGVKVELFPAGKKVFEAIKKMGISCNTALMEQPTSVSYPAVSSVAAEFMSRFAAGEYDRIELIYTRFLSAAKQLPVRETYLPIDFHEAGNKNATLSHEFIIEPGREELLTELLPRVIKLRLFTALLDSAAAEHAARMMAMQIATDNADDLISELVLEYNKGRQQAITNELLDIVSGSVNQ